MTVIARWTITSAYTEHDTGDPDCPNYRVAATVEGPEQREPVEVVPAEQLEGAVEALRELLAALDDTLGPPPSDGEWAAIVKARAALREIGESAALPSPRTDAPNTTEETR